MPNADGTDFEARPTLARADGKTLAWRHSEGTTKVETDLELPSEIDFATRYREHAELGVGGMGRVARCEDLQIGRHVAVKRLLSHYRDALEASRFVREARVQAQLEHPAVVPVYDLGLDADGQPWFSMKRISGVTLAEVVDALARGEQREAWSQRRLLTAMSQVCLAVDFAHQRGVIHRDLKPENVMLGDFGEVYVLDWGLAKRFEPTPIGRRPSAPLEQTSPGVVLGTPGFMSPEQIRGLPLGPATDVYALGAILFEVLTLEPLQPPDEIPSMLRAALDGLEVRPSSRAPQRELAPELEAIIVRALEPDPSRRYPSARALSEAIEAVLDGQRDVELRQKLATEHAERAAQLLARDDPEARRSAMQAIGRALALDPDDPGATAILRGLLTQAPRERPPAVTRALERSDAHQRGWAGRVAAVAYISFLGFFPVMVWAGIRSLSATLPFFVAMLIAGLISYFGTRDGRADVRVVVAAMIVSNIGIACATTLFGALVLLPTMAAVNATAYALTFSDRRLRAATAVVASLALIVPLALELAGVIGPSYAFTGEGMLTLPWAIDLHERATIAILAASGVVTIVTGTVTVGRVRAALLRAEEQLYTYTWQVQQLLPDTAHGNSGTPLEATSVAQLR